MMINSDLKDQFFDPATFAFSVTGANHLYGLDAASVPPSVCVERAASNKKLGIEEAQARMFSKPIPYPPHRHSNIPAAERIVKIRPTNKRALVRVKTTLTPFTFFSSVTGAYPFMETNFSTRDLFS